MAVRLDGAGAGELAWKANDRLRLDTVFMPYHWRECNVLVADDLDRVSKIPGFKYTAVSLAPVTVPAVADAAMATA